MLTGQGQWATLSRPYIDTTADGLGLLFDALGTPEGVLGTDYGPTTAKGSMTDLSTLENEWDPVGMRLLIRAATSPNSGSDYVLSGYKTDDGFIDLSASPQNFPGEVRISDFIIRGNGDVNTPGQGRLNGVQQLQTAPRVVLEDGHIEGQKNRNINCYDMTIRRCLLDRTGADNVGPGEGGAGVKMEECLMRRCGNDTVVGSTAHGDSVQFDRSDGFSFTRGTAYLPGVGSTYDEGNFGVTSNFFLEGGENQTLEEIYILGSLLVCGNHSVRLSALDGALVRNCVFAFNKHNATGTGYGPNGAYLINQTVGSGKFYNIAFFNEELTSGGDVPVSGTAVPAGYTTGDWGVFNWSKANASPKFIAALKQIGTDLGVTILDGNDDLNPTYNLGLLS